ncbi:hypothetical protein [Paenibacillus solani]|uniref:hypothetical protein n=1 Tax=Paenibacillus solani TaxID=1705565 RepID=UPI003D2D3264
MDQVQVLLNQTHSWAVKHLLRGLQQLTLEDLDELEHIAGEALQLQLAFMSELMEHFIEAARQVVLGGDEEEAMLFHYARLVQYLEQSGALKKEAYENT